MNTLTIDPGTVTGWAMAYGPAGMSGTWNFKPRRGDGGGVRFLRLRHKLNEWHAIHKIERIVYELPAGHYKSGAADDVIKGLVSHIQSWSEENDIPYEGVAPSELKKYATGKGNAKKDVMLATAQKSWPEITDHNEADARLLLQMVLDGELD